MDFEANGFIEVKNDNSGQSQRPHGNKHGSGSGGYQGNNGTNYRSGSNSYNGNSNYTGKGANNGGRPYGNGGSSYGGDNRSGGRGGYQGGGGSRNSFQGNNVPFNRNQPPEGPVEFYMPYVATGPRDTPQPVIDKIVSIVKDLEARGYTLRNAGREPAEDLFEKSVTRKEIHLPWRGFLNKDSKFTFTLEAAKVLAARFYPGYDGLKPAIQAFLAADVRMVMGKELRSPALFLITWSEDGAESAQERTAKTGTAAQAIAVASTLKIPVFNFGKSSTEERFRQYLGNAHEQQKSTQSQQSTQQPTQGGFNQGNNHVQ